MDIGDLRRLLVCAVKMLSPGTATDLKPPDGVILIVSGNGEVMIHDLEPGSVPVMDMLTGVPEEKA